MAEVVLTAQDLVTKFGFDEAAKIYADFLGVGELEGREMLSIALGITTGDTDYG